MGIWAIVPVKPLRRGKSRLSGILNEEERARLNADMLSHTLTVLNELPQIQKVLVVSRDPAALTIARDMGAVTLQEDGAPHLNTALRRAAAVASVYNAIGVLIIPADIPLLKADDILKILSCSDTPPVVTLVPDRHRNGTNAMYQSPAGLIDFAYGIGSFQKHCERVGKTNARLEILETPSLGLDLDLPEDIELLRAIEPNRLEFSLIHT